MKRLIVRAPLESKGAARRTRRSWGGAPKATEAACDVIRGDWEGMLVTDWPLGHSPEIMAGVHHADSGYVVDLTLK